MNSSLFVLDINGQLVTGWERFSITFDMENLSTQFEFDLYDKEGSIADSLDTGLACRTMIDNVNFNARNLVVANGYLVARDKELSAESHTFSLRGNDKLVDIIDCSAQYTSQTWSNTRFSQIIKALLEPFGLDVDTSQLRDDNIIERFTIQSGESAFDSVERLCRHQAVLPLSTFDGDLLLGYAATETDRADDLEVGFNVKSIRETVSWEERFSEYTGLSQYPGNGRKWSKEILQNMYKATDEGVTRFRPMLFIAESKADRKTLEQRVKWEAQVRSGRATRHDVTVSGFFQKNSRQLWEKNKRVNLRCEPWGLNVERLITKVTFEQSDAGELTTLSLAHPDIFKPDPSEKVDLT